MTCVATDVLQSKVEVCCKTLQDGYGTAMRPAVRVRHNGKCALSCSLCVMVCNCFVRDALQSHSPTCLALGFAVFAGARDALT